MNPHPFFSIIIPLYNAELYIRECIDSILSQGFTDYEVIVVDDGCNDNSVSIVEQYKDDRIKIIHQSNSGAAVARQNGVEHACGTYLLFIDSDDCYMNDALFTLYSVISDNGEIDIVEFGIAKFWEDKRKFTASPSIFESVEIIDNPGFLLKSLLLYKIPSMCTKVIKREKWVNGLAVVRVDIGEDYYQVFKLIEQNLRWCFIPDVLYLYRNNNTVTSAHKIELLGKYTDSCVVKSDMLSYIEQNFSGDTELNLLFWKVFAKNIASDTYWIIKTKKGRSFLKAQIDYLHSTNIFSKWIDSNWKMSMVDLRLIDKIVLIFVRHKMINLIYLLLKFL